MGMTDERLQEITDSLDETCRLFDFDNQPKERNQMFHDMQELITALEASFIAIDAAKLFMGKAEKERDELQADNPKALELIAQGLTSETKLMTALNEIQAELIECRAEVERLLRVAEMYDSHKPFLRVHGFSAEELDA